MLRDVPRLWDSLGVSPWDLPREVFVVVLLEVLRPMAVPVLLATPSLVFWFTAPKMPRDVP